MSLQPEDPNFQERVRASFSRQRFAAGSRRVRSAIRSPVPTARHNYNDGFRVALTLSD
jgi:hypothetical protein